MNQPGDHVTALRVCEVAVRDLRCHEEIRWSCEPGLNIVIGANGSGKTSLLEAVYLMSFGRSFRQARDPFLVRRGQQRFLVQGSWRRFGPMQIAVAGKRGQVTLKLQGREVKRRRDVSDGFPVLVEAPQGRRLVDGAPNERRRWLDTLVMACFPGLNLHYDRYLRAVMQRSRLLRRRVVTEELDAWEQQIVRHGLPIVEYRQRILNDLNRALEDEAELTETPLQLSLRHAALDETGWLKRLRDRRLDDMRIGGLRFGPHCDGLQMQYRQREIRSAGSRGQQKLAAIAIKMAECALWRQYRHMLPVLLLDDCLEALDDERQQRALRRLAVHAGQVLMTAPSGTHVPPSMDIHQQYLRQGKLVPVKAGPDRGSQNSTMEEAA